MTCQTLFSRKIRKLSDLAQRVLMFSLRCVLKIYIIPDKWGYPHNVFLISPQKHVVGTH